MTTHVADQGRHYEFGQPDRLRAAREQAGLSQAALAELTGISLKSITRYEAGDTVPRHPQLIVWSMATGFSVDWLDTGKVLLPPTNGGKDINDEYEQIPGGNVINFPWTAWQRSHSVAILQRAA
jgi:transcriptional regulator with XRE-family HTH domain